MGRTVRAFQALAVLETVHTATGFVRGLPHLALLQWLGRANVLFIILSKTPQLWDHPASVIMMTAWALGEVFRYPWYAAILMGRSPYLLTWLRYSAPIVIYPIGVTAEMALINLSLPSIKARQLLSLRLPNQLNYAFDYHLFLQVALVLYIPLLIPRILHQVYLDGDQALKLESRRSDTGFRQEWLDSCKRVTKGWTQMFWDLEKAKALLSDRYPWFLPAFAAYPKTVLRGDAIRPFILHAYGGLYLDMDVECFKSPERFLAGFDLVFQSEFGDATDINNAIMAGVPGHPFWMQMMILLFMKYDQTLRTDISWSLILDSTGPGVSRTAFRTFFPGIAREHNYLGAWRATSSTVKVFGLGTWYCPCQWNDQACHIRIDELHGNGTLPSNLVGHHRYSGSWTPTKHGLYREQAILLADGASRLGASAYIWAVVLLAVFAFLLGHALHRYWSSRQGAHLVLPTTVGLSRWARGAAQIARMRGD
ncbi:hypothetical protein WJX84_011942 [Apatococcus fuscideae]|uniref:Very-long-chain (3R)-3-hydroxyacyl-CoA dehydratase n=1 Tax=Apatococcus fuscideae TaxID=2026836 RepID=A0AAW1TEU3_9CHLO